MHTSLTAHISDSTKRHETERNHLVNRVKNITDALKEFEHEHDAQAVKIRAQMLIEQAEAVEQIERLNEVIKTYEGFRTRAVRAGVTTLKAQGS